VREGRGRRLRYDGTQRCFERWRYAGGASITRQADGTLQTGPGAPNLGVLWYAARPYGDFVLKLQLRDDAPASDARGNSGVQVRFPAPHPRVPGCPTTFNGSEQNDAGRRAGRVHFVAIATRSPRIETKCSL
jgi:hypothetical protein